MELVGHLDGREERIRVERLESGYRIQVGEREYLVDSVSTGADLRSLLLEGRQHEVAVRNGPRGSYLVTSSHLAREVEVTDPLTFLARQSRGGGAGRGVEQITAYMPGRVVALHVAEGEAVQAGQGLLVLEAMKMENEIQAPHDATIRRILVQPGQTVEGGDVLFELG